MSTYDMSQLQICPLCRQEMAFDLILNDGRGVNSLSINVKPDEKSVDMKATEEIAGYGFFCKSCQRGWTGDELHQMNTKEVKKK